MAVVQEQPGITRDRLYEAAEWNGVPFELVDTGGILFGDEDPLVEQIRLQAQVALQEADAVMFVVDANDGCTPADQDLANALRGIKKPLLLIANKADNPSRDSLSTDFYRLGFGEVLPISALHGRGVAEVLDELVEHLNTVELAETDEQPVRIAIVGRPNVGKSSLLNAISGEQRAIVSNIPGTTRDAIDLRIQFRNEPVILVDTAGIRRRGKVQGSVEYYMVLRAERAMARADVALIVLDGNEGVTDGDKRIGKSAHDLGKSCVIAVNKWDLVEPPDGRPSQRSAVKKGFAKSLRAEFPELNYAPVCFASASQSTGLEAALDACMEAAENKHFRIPTGALNRIVREAVFNKPFSRKGKPLRIYYATQTDTAPPTFLMFCNDPELVHFSYERYLHNCIRDQYPLEGTPIRLVFRSSRDKDGGGK